MKCRDWLHSLVSIGVRRVYGRGFDLVIPPRDRSFSNFPNDVTSAPILHTRVEVEICHPSLFMSMAAISQRLIWKYFTSVYKRILKEKKEPVAEPVFIFHWHQLVCKSFQPPQNIHRDAVSPEHTHPPRFTIAGALHAVANVMEQFKKFLNPKSKPDRSQNRIDCSSSQMLSICRVA